jgi:hypothetical protein
MIVIRRYLRVCTALWALGQCAMLAAFVPRDCCAAHRPAPGEASGHCDETVDGVECPMRGPDGQHCPMHRRSARHGHATGPEGDQPDQAGTCSIRGNCSGPLAALGVILSAHGPVPEAVTIPFNPTVRLQARLPELELRAESISPDPPPPRA